ncbi:MAG TPA: helix-turn-helix domain-containing protein [Candidatus Lokiarchaeia archaeon]|nr:helix-turn-helix domain-containing protein [Candidatus Lokiarchaeia archaeon]
MDLITERGSVDDFLSRLNEKCFSVNIKYIGPVNMSLILTETQETILEMAMRKKYFEIPRVVKLRELAAEIGIGASSLSESLHRIFKKLSLNYIFENNG